jgi:hypothetical protein
MDVQATTPRLLGWGRDTAAWQAERVDPSVSYRMLRTLEPFHGMIYFVPEGHEAYTAAGLKGRRMGYFASRSAAMGPVPPEVVIATFYNFHPDLVRRAIPQAWALASPSRVLEARLEAADRALRRMLGEAITSAEMTEAAELARQATEGCRPEGRSLYAGHASLPWPSPSAPHLVLWHAQTLLREFRGDGHIAALVAAGLSGIEALVVHQATGELATGVLQISRAWSDEEWAAGEARIRERGWLADDGTLTEAGRLSRQELEDLTDRLALPCWEQLGEPSCTRLRELVRPWSRTIADQAFAGGLTFDDES